MSAPTAPTVPTVPSAVPTVPAPPASTKGWFHPRPFFLGLLIALALAAVVGFLWYLLTNKNLLATWGGPS